MIHRMSGRLESYFSLAIEVLFKETPFLIERSSTVPLVLTLSFEDILLLFVQHISVTDDHNDKVALCVQNLNSLGSTSN